MDELDENQLWLWRYTDDDDDINNQNNNDTMKDGSDAAKQQRQDSAILFGRPSNHVSLLLSGKQGGEGGCLAKAVSALGFFKTVNVAKQALNREMVAVLSE